MLYEAQFRNPAGAGKLIQAIRDMDLPELRYFCENFLGSFALTLDEME